MVPHIKLRLHGFIVDTPIPLSSSASAGAHTGLTIKLPPLRSVMSVQKRNDRDDVGWDDVSDSGEISQHDDVEGSDGEIQEKEDSEAGFGSANDDGDEEDDVDVDILQQVEAEAMECQDQEREDCENWEVEEDEKRSPNRDYVFCPAHHRPQPLRLITEHFCLHSLLPERDGIHSPSEIRRMCVREMYFYCYTRGLRELWAYMWNCWYAPAKWKLWARSFSLLISRWRTTMTVENYWKQLKHTDLHFLIHPRLDQLVYIICVKVVPRYMQRAHILEDTYRGGRSRPLTSYQVCTLYSLRNRAQDIIMIVLQRGMKTEWKDLQSRSTSGRSYNTNVEQWTCDCGRQKYSAYCICKHLVQAVPNPSAKFWIQLSRRRTLPIYQHPELHAIDQPSPPFRDPDAGTISEGDDQNFLGDPEMLSSGEAWQNLVLNGPQETERSKRGRSWSSGDHMSLPASGSDIDDISRAESEDEQAEEDTVCNLPILIIFTLTLGFPSAI